MIVVLINFLCCRFQDWYQSLWVIPHQQAQTLIEIEQELHIDLDEEATFTCIPLQLFPVDEGITFLTLLQEVHEFSLSLSQVDIDLLIAVELLALVLGQPLVGVHNLETHLFVISSLNYRR